VLVAVLILEVALAMVPAGRNLVRAAFWRLMPSPAPTVVALAGGPAEVGREHGRQRRLAIRLLCHLYVRRILCGNDPERLREHGLRARALFARIDPRWREEVAAIGEAAGVDGDVLMLGNAFLDLGLHTAGCRQVMVANADTALHAHSMDWDNLGGVGNFLVTIFRTEGGPGRQRTVHVGFPGMAGALSIVNEKGISLCFNQVRTSDGDVDHAVFLFMRELAETCASMAEVERRLDRAPRTMPFCLGVMDAAAGAAAVFERDLDQRLRRRDMADGLLAADNTLQAGHDDRPSPVAEVARAARPRTHHDVIGILRHPRVLLECNIYSVVFDPRHNRLLLASGGIPAALGEYQEFVLFP
jgi:hypothetical protein